MAAMILGLVAAGLARGAAEAGSRPNIVFILADDLGYGDVACYGRRDVRTPAIDRLAVQGVRFLAGYANAPVCSATRTALITGRYQYRLRVGLEEPIAGNLPEIGLPPEHPTLPSLLRRAGYRTLLVGKWHLGALPKFGPLQSGYEHFYGFRGGAVDYFTHQYSKPDLWEDDTPIQQVGYLTTLLGDRAVRAIGDFARRQEPFLLSLHFSAPHWPWEGPDDEAEAKRLQAAGSKLGHADGGSTRTYVAMIEAMDREIGRVLGALDQYGLTSNTLVVFTSDNGGERFSYNWPFTGVKTELLEGGLRVPAIVSWPARIPKGRTSDQVMISMDWLPTLLAAAGTAPDPAYPSDGLNLLPHLTSDAAPVSRRLFWRYKANAQQAVRDGDDKYLKIGENSFLFGLADDPMERANLKSRRPERFRDLAQAWYDWHQTMLPLTEESYTYNIDGVTFADRYGVKRASTKPEHPQPPAK
ncbi:MAG: sulfatase-like hydrolase/transferase [Verrucomicrobia bacterium]|nr:sulfatase-like hydrolase/transferase [Verrucomicrobiota bacterium]